MRVVGGCPGNLEGNESHERNQLSLPLSLISKLNSRSYPSAAGTMKHRESLHQYPQRPSMATIEIFQRADCFEATPLCSIVHEWKWKRKGSNSFVFFFVSQSTTLFIPPVSSPFLCATQNKTTPTCDPGSSRWGTCPRLLCSGKVEGGLDWWKSCHHEFINPRGNQRETRAQSLRKKEKEGNFPLKKGLLRHDYEQNTTLAPMITDRDRRQHNSSHWFVM